VPFNAEITFTGICALVLDSSKPRGVIVAPSAWSATQIHSTKLACDGQTLRRHRCFLDVPLKHLENNSNAPDGLRVLQDLHNKRVRFEISGGPADLQTGDLSNVANWSMVAPKFSTVDPSILVKKPPPDRLSTQILLHRGVLRGGAPLQRGTGIGATADIIWVFPGTLTGNRQPFTKKLTPDLILRLDQVDSLAVKLDTFDGTLSETLTLDGTTGDVKMTIAHLCDNNPLRWDTQINELPPDGDFRWYFDLLDAVTKEAIVDALKFGLPLPVPFPTNVGNGQGVNCFPSRSSSQVLSDGLFS